MKNYALSKSDTLTVKGIAICAMLWYHLFGEFGTSSEYGVVVYQTAQIGKVCVALFLFASAYGLTVQYSKILEKPIVVTVGFQARRFVRFYANYWIIFLIFVPLGVLVFGRTLHESYGAVNPLKSIFIDFLGLKGYCSYDTTWWFNLLIITMYLFFPLLYFLVKKIPVLLLIFCTMLWFVPFPILPIDTHEYVFHFVLGIFITLNINKISDFLNCFPKWLILVSGVIVFALLVMQRTYSIVPFFIQTRIDAFLSPVIVLLSVLLFGNEKSAVQRIGLLRNPIRRAISVSLQFLGKHSINIYLIHSSIYYYWFSDFFYSFRNPFLIFAVLMIICLIVSVLIEQLKKMLRIQNLLTKVDDRIEKNVTFAEKIKKLDIQQ